MFADSAGAGKRVAQATRIAVEIVRKAANQAGFRVQKRRWVVERPIRFAAQVAGIGRNRRFFGNAEKLVPSAEAFLDRLGRHPAAHAPTLLIRFGMGFQSGERQGRCMCYAGPTTPRVGCC